MMDSARAIITATFEFFVWIQPAISTAAGLAIVGYVVKRLVVDGKLYTHAERAGMSLVAGGIVMATPALWIADTPFDGWTFNIGRLGVALFIISGGLRRDRHKAKNDAQVEYWAGFRDGQERERHKA